MKKYKMIYRIIPVFIGLLLLATACEDELDINPWQSLSDEQALTTLSGIENAVTGCFDGLQDENLLGTNVIQNAEVKCQYIHWQGSYTSYTEMSQKDIQPNNTDVSGMWIAGYDGINRCNKVIEAVDKEFDLWRHQIYILRVKLYFAVECFISKWYKAIVYRIVRLHQVIWEW